MRKGCFLIAALAVAAGCTVHKTEVPPLAGPSEAALSVLFSATPDSITQDGVSQSTLKVVVRDANAKPVSGQGIQFQITSNGVPVDYGSLSVRTVYTASDGTATSTYTAPPPPPLVVGNIPSCSGNGYQGLAGPCVTIVASTIEGNYQLSGQRSVDVRLVPPPTPEVDPSALTASFAVSSYTPAVNDVVTFYGTASHAPAGHAIVSWAWDMGDGEHKSGSVVSHDFVAAGTYNVTLTVTDDTGQTASVTQAIIVQ